MYLNNFTDNKNILEEFQAPSDALDGCEVLYASYNYGCYEGDALVIYRKDDKLYEVNGGHCSCYGLEGQWQPEETFPEALKKKSLDFCDNEQKQEEAFKQFVEQL